jgi:hypothetical protein
MNTKFSIFENISAEPQVGDYVFVRFSNSGIFTDVKKIMNNEIGKIVKIKSKNIYHVDFRTVHICWNIHKDDIYKFSPNKEELEHYVSAYKYNL